MFALFLSLSLSLLVRRPMTTTTTSPVSDCARNRRGLLRAVLHTIYFDTT